jgi:hypothetical protein
MRGCREEFRVKNNPNVRQIRIKMNLTRNFREIYASASEDL